MVVVGERGEGGWLWWVVVGAGGDGWRVVVGVTVYYL